MVIGEKMVDVYIFTDKRECANGFINQSQD